MENCMAVTLEWLEQRVLLGAGVGPDILWDVPVPAQCGPGAVAEQVQSVPGSSAAQTSPSGRHELVFLDSGVPEYPVLLNDLRSQAANGRQLNVAVLDARHDGIDQISEVLATYHDLDAVHIISHGAGGTL